MKQYYYTANLSEETGWCMVINECMNRVPFSQHNDTRTSFVGVVYKDTIKDVMMHILDKIPELQ